MSSGPAPPNKQIRGIREPIASGTVLGRTSGGMGATEQISISDLTDAIINTGKVITTGGINPGPTQGVTEIVAGQGLTGGTITTSGTIALETIAASSLFGNPATVAGTMEAIGLGTGLKITSDTLIPNWQAPVVASISSFFTIQSETLTVPAIPAGFVISNQTAGSAIPGAYSIGQILSSQITNANSQIPFNYNNLLYEWGALDIGTGLSVTGTAPNFTLSAGSAGGITTIVAGTGLTGGTITGSGTIGLDPLGAGLALNSGTLVANWQAATITAIGSGLTLASGTLNVASGSGTIGVALAPSLALNNGTLTTAEGSDGIRPAASAFINYNTGTLGAGTLSVIDNAGGPLQMRLTGVTVGNTSNIVGLMQTITATGTLTARVRSQGVTNQDNSMMAGLIAVNAQNGSIVTFGRIPIGGDPGYQLYIERWSSPTGFSSAPFNGYDMSLGLDPWFRIVNNGTVLSWYISRDQAVWSLIGTETISAFLGTLHYLGFAMNIDGALAGADLDLLLDHWAYQ
jgi:hypothetical protein